MKISIKKIYLISFIGLIFLVSGFYLFNLVISSWYSFIQLVLFFVSLVLLINYFLNYRFKVKLAKESATETVDELKKENPELFSHKLPETLVDEIESHLISKIEDENYVVWGEKIITNKTND